MNKIEGGFVETHESQAHDEFVEFLVYSHKEEEEDEAADVAVEPLAFVVDRLCALAAEGGQAFFAFVRGH